MKWEDDEIEFLKACREASWTNKEISNELARTLISIQKKAEQYKIKSKYCEKLTNKDIDKKYKNITRLGNYINAQTKLKVSCNICNYIWKVIPTTLQAGHGCPSCNNNAPLTNFDIDIRLKNRSINRIEDYTNGSTRIHFQCTACANIWKSTAQDIFRGRGCPDCANYGFKENLPGTTYFIYFKELDIYKIGITKNIIERMSHFGYTPEIIMLRHFKLGKDARDLETQWLINIKEYKINTGKLKSGNTETFRYKE